MSEMTQEVSIAIYDLLYTYDIGDFCYQIRESAEIPEGFGGSTWHLPEVVRFGDIVKTLKAAVPKKDYEIDLICRLKASGSGLDREAAVSLREQALRIRELEGKT